MNNYSYCIYPTLLDSFQNYLNSSVNYQKFWGNSEDPSKTEDEYEKECFNELINRINRVPFESEAADRGTAFNEIVDCLVAKTKSDKMDISSNKENGTVTAIYNNRKFVFPLSICIGFADYFKSAVSQVYCEAKLETQYGNVLLYGYIDELLSTKICDIKTTKKYEAFKYRNNWQHKVYPYCLEQQGSRVSAFEYCVCEIKGNKYDTYVEYYNYLSNETKEELTAICEQFIEFLNANRELITDKKILKK